MSNWDFDHANQFLTQINEAARRIDGDGLRIIPPERLADLLRIGIEINHGNNPPNIEGAFNLRSLVFVRSIGSGFWNVPNTDLRFSNQDNETMTVRASGWDWVNTNSFITGSGNKFTAFIEFFHGDVIDIYSGEITPTGIRNFQMVEIRPNGYLGLWVERDGFSPRIFTSNQSLGITITNIPPQYYSTWGIWADMYLFLPGTSVQAGTKRDISLTSPSAAFTFNVIPANYDIVLWLNDYGSKYLLPNRTISSGTNTIPFANFTLSPQGFFMEMEFDRSRTRYEMQVLSPPVRMR